ncbi:hypothetical protein LCGC14_2159330 [marine sediment metagenome]|uniref:Uncharacterized protein n=1 Tax=marine sediment metagenome TaxID=412755 RepID=A0A0F9EFH5_9ZZZZ
MAAYTAISDAIKEAARRIIGNTPPGVTGVYFSERYGITFGYQHRDNRAIPENYIWFEDQPKKLQRYDEHIQAGRAPITNGDIVTLIMNARQANVLYRLSGNVGGDPSGARVVFDKLYDSLHAAGIDGMSDHSLRITAPLASPRKPTPPYERRGSSDITRRMLALL